MRKLNFLFILGKSDPLSNHIIAYAMNFAIYIHATAFPNIQLKLMVLRVHENYTLNDLHRCKRDIKYELFEFVDIE